MINGIVRSPSEFFDVTPSGMLLNKFSSDLGILDNSLSITIMDMFEGPAATLVAFANICQIDIYFLLPVCIIIPMIIALFIYSRPAIIQCKQKDLKNKSPIFHCFSETINGLVQIRTYGRRESLMHKFTEILNNSTRAVMAFDVVARGFSFVVTLGGIALMIIGIELGVYISTPMTVGLFGVTVMFLVQFS
jgi:ABC-type multidrug transport system fused ATPase/permease subunit